MKTYASRRAYVEELYADVLLDLKRIQRHAPSSKNWGKANDVLADELTPIRAQWLKAKSFIYSTTPDFENSIKESISAVESCLMVLLNDPNGTLGKLIKQANLDPDIERLVSQAYGAASNKAFVRHGGTVASGLTGVSEFLCKRVGLQLTEMRSPNSMVKRVRAAFQSRMGRVHFWLMLRRAR